MCTLSPVSVIKELKITVATYTPAAQVTQVLSILSNCRLQDHTVYGNDQVTTHPVKHRQHHVELLLLLLLGHVARRVAQLGEQAPQVHQAQGVVLGAALLLPRPPHDPLHHVHLERLCQGKGSPVWGEERLITWVNGCWLSW